MRDVQLYAGDIANGGSAAAVRIDLSRLKPETAFRQAVTEPLKRLREAGDTTQVVVLVDALDEGFAPQAAKKLPRLLGCLENVHLVVTTRPDPRVTHWFRDRAVQVDLLADSPRDTDDLLDYAHRRLAPKGGSGAMAVLARRVAEHAAGNFLYAFHVIEDLCGAHGLAAMDEAAARLVPLPEGGLPAVYRDFFRRELGRDERGWSRRLRPVLAPLAVARDDGLTIEQLRLVASRLGDEAMDRSAVRDVTRTVRQFLDGLDPDGPFRLYHQSFADFLTDPGQNPDFLVDTAETHEALVMAYTATDPRSWDSYARRNLALHAREAGQLDPLLEDARFLLAADPARLMTHLDSAMSTRARAAAAVYRGAVHRTEPIELPARASQLELAARQLGCHDLAAKIADAAPDRPWQTRWSHGRPITNHQVLTGHRGPVRGLAVAALPDGTPVIVSGGADGTVRVWRLADGTPVGEPLRGHDGTVKAVAAAALPDGTPVIVSGGADGTVRVWRLADGTAVGEPLRGHDGAVQALAVAKLPDGTPVIVSGGDDGKGARVWRLADGTPVGQPIASGSGSVQALAAGALPDGTPVIIGATGGVVLVWRLADGAPVGEALRGDLGPVQAVVTGALPDGTPVIVGGSWGGKVQVWRLADGGRVGEPLPSNTLWTDALATGALPDGTPIIVSGGPLDGIVRVWRLGDGTPVGEPLPAHAKDVCALATGTLPDDTPVIVSGGDDGTVRVWRLGDGTPVGEPTGGHSASVRAVAAAELLDGTPVIVSGGDDGTVRVWRLADGTPVREPLDGHDSAVKAVTTASLPDGTPVIVSGSDDGTIRLWQLEDGTPVIVSGSDDGTIRVTRLADGTSVPETLGGSLSSVNAVAAGALPDGTPVIVSGSGQVIEGMARVWRLEDGTPVGEPMGRYSGSVNAVAVGTLLDGTPVIVSGGGGNCVWRLDDGTRVAKLQVPDMTGSVDAVAVGALPDGTPVVVGGSSGGFGEAMVRVWRLADGNAAVEPMGGHTSSVSAVALGKLPDGTSVIVSGGNDGTVRVWRLDDGTSVVPPLYLAKQVRSLALHGNIVISAAGADIAVHQIALSQPSR